jgi:KipI family sensor histidine kinase inhibitor
VRFLSAGDTALTVEFGDTAELALSAQVLALDRRLTAAGLPGVVETVPTLRSLTVYYRPAATSAKLLKAAIAPLCEGLEGLAPEGRCWQLPVAYGGEFGPDLEHVARHAQMTEQAVADLHASVGYRVYMIGFLPGHPYMGDLPALLRLPRRDTPRVAVPAGSVAIATSLTVVYPWESPGGWHILGRSPAPLFDAAWSPPSLLAPGDRVTFQSISPDDLKALRQRIARGEWRPQPMASSG